MRTPCLGTEYSGGFISRRFAPWPGTTLTVLLGIGLVTGLQFAFLAVLFSWQRTATALPQQEWWRLITPLFVQSGGWRQIAFNFPAILLVGSFVEGIWGSRRWLLLYFVGGFVGELAGYVWQPYGAGSSVAGAGLLGGLAVWLVGRPVLPGRLGGLLILVGGAILTCFHDIHGPPLLAGAGLTWALPPKRNRSPR